MITLNTQRQKSNEQLGREFAKLRQIEAERARARMAQAPGQPRGIKTSAPERVPEQRHATGDARDVAASKLGVSGKHAERERARMATSTESGERHNLIPNPETLQPQARGRGSCADPDPTRHASPDFLTQMLPEIQTGLTTYANSAYDCMDGALSY